MKNVSLQAPDSQAACQLTTLKKILDYLGNRFCLEIKWGGLLLLQMDTYLAGSGLGCS